MLREHACLFQKAETSEKNVVFLMLVPKKGKTKKNAKSMDFCAIPGANIENTSILHKFSDPASNHQKLTSVEILFAEGKTALIVHVAIIGTLIVPVWRSISRLR